MMNLIQACSVVAQQRPIDSLLVATMGAMFAFDRIELEAAGGDASQRPPGRISSVPLMGGAAGLGLGLSLAMPERAVVVVDGDASSAGWSLLPRRDQIIFYMSSFATAPSFPGWETWPPCNPPCLLRVWRKKRGTPIPK
ncbi:MAG: hypothetical protein NTY26_05575 [Burkholderiales bacterium]|nr:hypothetical protein [Burkholderiales bacterium]